MYHIKRYCFFIAFIIFSTFYAKGQYTLNGSATQNSCNCYTLTKNEMNTAGSVWNNNKIDLNKSFDFWFNVYLGCSDVTGADGIVFILQTENKSVGRNGSGIGFANVSPSIRISLDTYQNSDPSMAINDLNDPSYDHISIQANGNVKHGADLAGPVRASDTSDNIEDCKWHVLRISWDAAGKKLQAYFDGSLRVTASTDLLKDIFQSNQPVYWGFSAATGGSYNLHQFCTALNPDFNSNTANNGTCVGSPVDFTNASVSFAPVSSYFWDLGDGTKYNTQNVYQHLYKQAGDYKVKLAITGFDGCKSDTLTQKITIGSVPIAGFDIFDTCARLQPRISFQNNNVGTNVKWLLNDAQLPDLSALKNLTAGTYNLKTVIASEYGCGADEATRSFTVKPIPVVESNVMDGCAEVPQHFAATQTDNGTTIQQWNWQLGNGGQSKLQNPLVTYTKAGNYNTTLWALADNGCRSDTVTKEVIITSAQAFAGNDTIVLNNVPFQLNGSGNGTALWQPSNGLSRNDVFNPTGILSDNQAYELTVTTAAGCVAKDSVFVEVFKGSAVYVPTAFTPDGNGRNDQLRPSLVGIRAMDFFTIFNRWGQPVFKTSQIGKGWDGTLNGKALPMGTYIWMLKATDITGKVYNMKGTFTLIR